MDDVVLKNNSKRRVVDCDLSKSSKVTYTPSMTIPCNAQAFDDFQKKVQSEKKDLSDQYTSEYDSDDLEDNFENFTGSKVSLLYPQY